MTEPLDYPLGAPPELGVLVPVAPPVWRVRMPLPFQLDHVNVWLIEGERGWTIIDAGLGDDPTRAIWDALFAGPLAGRPIERVLVTHMHPDHAGLAGMLAARTGAPIVMPLAEWQSALLFRLDRDQVADGADLAFLTAVGVPDDARPRDRRSFYRDVVSAFPPTLRRVRAGDVLTIGGVRWHARIGEGHSVEMLCLHAPDLNVLIAADQVLPRITPNVSVWPEEPLADPLALFLDTLARFADLPAGTLVLPSHGEPFHGLHPRLSYLSEHHEERLSFAAELCRRPITAWDMTAALFQRPLDAHQRLFAIGETVAHLNRLVGQGRIRRDISGPTVRYEAL
jgi:glyoxylase-like metal-dependent hydrolase (beta-lactamase superfamily II)